MTLWALLSIAVFLFGVIEFYGALLEEGNTERQLNTGCGLLFAGAVSLFVCLIVWILQ